MVTGLNRFRQHFASYANQYVLIGGTALIHYIDTTLKNR